MKTLTILGSTGSIGVSTLDIVEKNPDKFKVQALAAGSNVQTLAGQIMKFRPSLVAVRSKEDASNLKKRSGMPRIKILYGESGIEEVAADPSSDIVVSAISGAAGLKPTLAAVAAGKNIALANKETMVIAGHIVTATARKQKVKILPVDSEHSAVFQCLSGQAKKNLRRIILTASGGPFLNLSGAQLKNVTVEQALKHPRWKMGRKITIDSASLMNKGLELIEAKWLFDLDVSCIDVLIHPQSIVHSLIEMIDGSVFAQLGIPDMRIPIAYALTYPSRIMNDVPKLDLATAGRLDFRRPDLKKFRCLALAFQAARFGGSMPAVLNAANEAAVSAFLGRKIAFGDIPKVVEEAMTFHQVIDKPSLPDVLAIDAETRVISESIIKKIQKG
jgi:1-deoxy-D-xylulose-5-phosphate reductoisomerase